MSDVDNKVKMIVEGLLLAAGRPLSLENISQVFSEDERPDKKELKTVMEAIAEDCDDRGFDLIEVSSGYRFQVKQELSEWVAKLWEEKPPRYTRALLETLALIAYRQPITRGDIEEIRGVGVSANIIRTLLDREWVRVVGHRDVPGRPAMFATTKQFLDYFNLKNLDELPPLAEVKELDKMDPSSLAANDDLAANQRVIDLPEEATDEASYEPTEEEKAEMLAEEEAIELSKKPLDEILNLPKDEPEPDYDFDDEEFTGDEAAEESDSDSGSDDDNGDIDVESLATAAGAFTESGDEPAEPEEGGEDEDGNESAEQESALAEVIPIHPQGSDDSATAPDYTNEMDEDEVFDDINPGMGPEDDDSADDGMSDTDFITEDDDELAQDFGDEDDDSDDRH